ncbi:Ubiquitin carboxyl-terminal hydrolase 14 [Caenorhabditis elegans]|uniref:Ubiquitin carboxyl-terminal hydrolase 14 n=1 Tax=Caenorhabditis elegans TaxID=6239 RepID=UBP14_CAEEL|nr:Ubiquitin carboxyl-terminal hydrolase 14 [Caenorhabditis elegans]Q17361.2 RecName: Full=Ubiquitin carboxyl-terminal hydrolase 14; AltName: Full=Deubiquitinating enzyme 14; AltName: Full=Ubiquitin thioesterase 14; AltName: Full=Ubiquitin-specific-processing protease 14 [Caenorhabditis elegans]CAB03876.1 Ubiquitin carboxyl-terminal hydrolase 14 [Caenorhabditis elegans]|eukprot:NP_497006.1 Ubiquitin carboxyl-terminal hydrolase 14 [Caenorhabditis elegans]
MPIVNVKWQKEKYVVEVDTSAPPMVFKAQLFALTQVVPERQKVVIMGRTLGDDDWEGITIKENMTIMMMGSVGEIPKPPTVLEKKQANRDKQAEEISALYPCGLANLGNTCYFNSCVQMLKEVNELVLKPAEEMRIREHNDRLCHNLATLFNSLRDKDRALRSKGEPIKPFAAILTLSDSFPQFEKFKQQDANECLVSIMSNVTRIYGLSGWNIESLFRIQTETTMKCLESDEVSEKKVERNNQLTCYVNQDVRFLQTGIKAGFEEEMTRNSEELNRDAKWQKNTQISRLPKYLTVNINRFFYKESTKTNAKILKSVQFPMQLDTYDLCSQELKDKLVARRADIKLEEDAKLERELRKKVLDKEQGDKIFDDGVALPTAFEDDAGSNNSGFYDLKGIITHKGRSSQDGHYVAWMRSSEDGKWRLFDDEHVTVVDEEAILKTSGGGDWHSAYVLLYEARVIKQFPELPPAPVPTEVAADTAEPMEVSEKQ